MTAKSVSKTTKDVIGLDLWDISLAAFRWYGSSDIDSCCLAENRLMAGEKHPVNTINKLKKDT